MELWNDIKFIRNRIAQQKEYLEALELRTIEEPGRKDQCRAIATHQLKKFEDRLIELDN